MWQKIWARVVFAGFFLLGYLPFYLGLWWWLYGQSVRGEWSGNDPLNHVFSVQVLCLMQLAMALGVDMSVKGQASRWAMWGCGTLAGAWLMVWWMLDLLPWNPLLLDFLVFGLAAVMMVAPPWLYGWHKQLRGRAGGD